MDFTAFDTTKLEEYARQAKQAWGTTPAYQEFEEKSTKRTPQESNTINAQLMAIVAAFGTLQTRPAQDPAVQAQVKTLKDFITRHYYTCNKQILAQLGQMYAAGGEFTKNINAARRELCGVAIGNRAAPDNMGAAFAVTKCGDGVLEK